MKKFEFDFEEHIGKHTKQVMNQTKIELQNYYEKNQDNCDTNYMKSEMDLALLKIVQATLEEYHNQLMTYLNERLPND